MKNIQRSLQSQRSECVQFIPSQTIQHKKINSFYSKEKKSLSKNKLLLLLLLSITFLPIIGYAQQPKQSRSPGITAFIKKQGLVMAKRANDWAKDKTEDILLNGVKEFIQKNNLDQNTASKILISITNNKKNLKQIYEGVSSTDVQTASLSTQLLIGKIIAENVPESDMSAMLKALTKYPDVAAEASQAIGSIAGGDYYKGSETIGKIIWKQTAIGKGINQAISIEKAGWDFLTHNQFDAAYQKYKEYGSEGLVRLYTGSAAYVREKYFQGRSVGDEVINAKMVELFETTLKNEDAEQAEQEKLERRYDMFKTMENTGGLIFDFRKHLEQLGISKEEEVFDRFLWLNRAMNRDLLSVGVDFWMAGKTLNSDNPSFSPEALALFMAYSQGGAAAYKAKFEEIARLHFPKTDDKKATCDTMHISILFFVPCILNGTNITTGDMRDDITDIKEYVTNKKDLCALGIKTPNFWFPVQIMGQNFSAKMKYTPSKNEPNDLADVTITGTFSKDRTIIEELTVVYSLSKPVVTQLWEQKFWTITGNEDTKWNFTARNIPYDKRYDPYSKLKSSITYSVHVSEGTNKEYYRYLSDSANSRIKGTDNEYYRYLPDGRLVNTNFKITSLSFLHTISGVRKIRKWLNNEFIDETKPFSSRKEYSSPKEGFEYSSTSPNNSTTGRLEDVSIYLSFYTSLTMPRPPVIPPKTQKN